MVAKAKKSDGEKKTVKTKDKDVMSRREKRTIPVKLTDKEKAKISTEHVETLDKIAAKEEEKKTADAAIKGDIALLEEAAKKLADIIRAGTQDRELDVDVIYNWRTNEVQVVRADTKEVISTRAMSYEERQREMFGVDHKKDKGEVKNAKKVGDGKPGERKTPVAGDAIEVETRAGWKPGKVLPSSGSVLDVEVEGEAEPMHIPIEAQIWRWPQKAGETKPAEGETDGAGDETKPGQEPLTATLQEHAEAKKSRKRGKKNPNGVDTTPPPGCAF